MNIIFEIEKDKTKEEVKAEIVNQIKSIKNKEIVIQIQKYLVEPTQHLAIWDYAEKETKYPAWLILSSETHDTGILFSEYGYDFGRWGLSKLSENPIHFGPDFQWYSTLEEAFLDSWMVEENK